MKTFLKIHPVNGWARRDLANYVVIKRTERKVICGSIRSSFYHILVHVGRKVIRVCYHKCLSLFPPFKVCKLLLQCTYRTRPRKPPSFKRGMNGPTAFGAWAQGNIFLYKRMFIILSSIMNIYLLTCMLYYV